MNFSPKHLSISAFLLLSSSLLLLPSISFAEDTIWTTTLPTQQRSKFLLKIAQRKKTNALRLKYKKIVPLQQEISTSNSTTSYQIPNIDQKRVEETRLQRVNAERESVGSNPYTLSSDLRATSVERAWILAKENRTSGTHRRSPQDSFYDYKKIMSRFSDRGVTESTITESVARNTYSCKETDCTDILLQRLKKWFDFFMSEKWKEYDPHYKSIASNSYKKIWLWVAVSNGRYFLVMHVSN